MLRKSALASVLVLACVYSGFGYYNLGAFWKKAVAPAGAMLIWDMQEGSGTSLADASGNGHTGTAGGIT